MKTLERAKKKLETKLKELAANEKKDAGLIFEKRNRPANPSRRRGMSVGE